MATTEKNAKLIEAAKSLKNVPWCDEYEKMISGMLYDPLNADLAASRFRARALCHKYNNWFPHDVPGAGFDLLADERWKQLDELFGKLGKDVFIEPPLNVDYGCNISVGDRFYANFNMCILDCSLVTIGNRTMFGPNVSIFAATHETEVQSRRDCIEYAREVVIGEDCWVGGHVVILPGITIGDGVTIGAGSIVTRDIPSWSVAIGNPARVVKKVAPIELDKDRASNK